jgi:UDP-perosamine 4-acetyltransferase
LSTSTVVVSDNADIVIVGGGGHAAVLVDALRVAGTVNVIGYVALREGALSRLGIEWLGKDDVMRRLVSRGIRHAVLGVAGAASNDPRRDLFETWRAAGFTFADVIHPRSTIAGNVAHDPGLQIFAGAVINIGARLGSNVIINTNATVEHDCEIGDHAHIAPGATLCGGVVVGDGTLVGAGSVVTPGVRLGRGVIVGAGSTVVRDVADGLTVAGNPATLLATKQRTHS